MSRRQCARLAALLAMASLAACSTATGTGGAAFGDTASEDDDGGGLLDTSGDATGSGDAFTAGIVYGWHNNLTFEETAIFASCLGAANASLYSVCKVDMETAEKYKQAVKIEPVGKKMKTLDVTPR